ncbi:hypothetical protein NMG60_11028072 [Bertholletia excelsa]
MRATEDDPQRESKQCRRPTQEKNSGLLRAVKEKIISSEKNTGTSHSPESRSGSQSETTIIFLQLVSQRRPKSFSIETKLGLLEHESIFSTRNPAVSYISFIEVQDGKSKVIQSNICGFKKILAACNGLVLGTCEPSRKLIVMNPVTRKFLLLPLGTIAPCPNESYGFVHIPLIREYKVVHLFRDESGYIGCEVLSINTRSWRAVDGPSFGLFRQFAYNPVVAIGALHWLPATDGCAYLVSMTVDDENFHTKSLPIPSSMNDRLVEMNGYLGYVTHVALDRIEVWILKGLGDENWVKRHIIMGYRMPDLIPISTLRHGREMVLKEDRDFSFYAYDFESQVIRKVEMEGEFLQRRGSFLPHVSSLALWESSGALW